LALKEQTPEGGQTYLSNINMDVQDAKLLGNVDDREP
jgi:hypothetical protein